MEIEKSNSESLILQAREMEFENSSGVKVEPKTERKKRGPYKKDKKPESEAKQSTETKQDPKFQIETKVLCYPILKAVSGMAVAYTRDSRAAMTPDEAEGCASAMGMVLDKWMPDAMAKWGPEIVLGVSLSQYGLRIYAIKQLQLQAARAKQAAEQESNQKRPNPDQKPAGEFLSVISEESTVP